MAFLRGVIILILQEALTNNLVRTRSRRGAFSAIFDEVKKVGSALPKAVAIALPCDTIAGIIFSSLLLADDKRIYSDMYLISHSCTTFLMASSFAIAFYRFRKILNSKIGAMNHTSAIKSVAKRLDLLQRVRGKVVCLLWCASIVSFPSVVALAYRPIVDITNRSRDEKYSTYYERYYYSGTTVLGRILTDVIILLTFVLVMYYAWVPVACLKWEGGFEDASTKDSQLSERKSCGNRGSRRGMNQSNIMDQSNNVGIIPLKIEGTKKLMKSTDTGSKSTDVSRAA
eukprot:CAMPEP_0167758824 /NCGR_PEP_ID=MMETSP0110_2-20121227/10685_1 /TAXON_ID=629695 /ORGANISM="Gymnochlora sp., Strain CCMP2014" /LENGTH=284 /DNA_ID=CAMNT_0007645147 /DNA_START=186 /DNA_END=1036 /DNA_ORIENTATION=-